MNLLKYNNLEVKIITKSLFKKNNSFIKKIQIKKK